MIVICLKCNMSMWYLLFRIKENFLRYIRGKIVKNRLNLATYPNVLGKIHINARNVKMGKNVTLYPGVYLWGQNIEIGDNVDIGIGTIIYAKKKVYIGSNTSIAGQCYIIDSNHGIAADELIRRQPMDTAKGGIYIGDDVWIAAQCCILKGAKINSHAVIGAKSLVNKEIPPLSVAFGTPAKVVSYRK